MHSAAELLSSGIDSFDKFGVFCSKLKVAANNNPGALGPYHRKLVLDQKVAARFVSQHMVQWMDCNCCTPSRSERLFKRAWLSMRSGTNSNAKVCCATATSRAPSGQHCVFQAKEKTIGDGNIMKTTVIYRNEQLQDLQDVGIVIDVWD